MCLNALNLRSHVDIWSPTESSKHSHRVPFVVPRAVHLRPSSCLHRGAQICKGKGSCVILMGPMRMFPRPLGFLHGTGYLHLGNRIKPPVLDLTHGTLDSVGKVFFTSCPTVLAGQTDIDTSSYRSSGARDSSLVTWLVFSHTPSCVAPSIRRWCLEYGYRQNKLRKQILRN